MENKELDVLQAKINELQAEMDRIKLKGSKPWPKEIKQGMKFKRECRIYQVCMSEDLLFEFVLVAMDMTAPYGKTGNVWDEFGFGGSTYESEFEYIPDAKTLVFATGEALIGKMCMVSNGDSDGTYGSRSKVIEYIPGKGYKIECGSCLYKYAIPLEALS